MSQAQTANSPASLVAIIVAARRAGDRDLERVARRELVERFGVKLTFAAGSRAIGQQPKLEWPELATKGTSR